MKIELVHVPESDKSILRQLMELYLHDFSEYELEDVNEHGFFGYPYLDNYWTESNRYPFFIKVDDQLAGFVLIRQIPSSKEPITMSIGEFFVMRKYRQRGIGRVAAIQAFKKFPGRWEVNQQGSNEPSKLFWEKVIAEHTQNNYEVKQVTEEDWEGQSIIFDNS